MIIQRTSQCISQGLPIITIKNKQISIQQFSNTQNPKAPQQAAKTQQQIHDFKSDHIIQQELLIKDQKYQEEAYKFNREWKKIADAKSEEQIFNLNQELSESQKKQCDLVADALLSMNTMETRYLVWNIQERLVKTSGINLMQLNIDWPSLKQLEDGSWPPVNPNWFKQQEAIAKLWPTGQVGLSQLFGGMVGFGGGAPATGGAPTQTGGAPQSAAPADNKKVQAKKQEKKVEDKKNFDVMLVGIKEADKIQIIKEVRQILGLGLKEAQDLVEKLPAKLKAGASKAQADELREKLEKVGCTLDLV